MGQGNSQDMNQSPPQEHVLDRYIKQLFGQLSETNKIELVNEPIIGISRNLVVQGSFSQSTGGFYVNPTILKCLYHPTFEKSLNNMLSLLVKELKSIFDTKIIALVSRERFRKALNIANFCIFFINQTLIQTVNLLSVRSDLDPDTEELVKVYTKDNPELNQQPLDSFQKEELFEMVRMLRISICFMIDLHLNLFTRSDFTLQIVDRLNQSAFVIYSKILFSQGKQIRKRQAQQNGKNLLKLASYFLGLGLEKKSASIYQIAVLQLQSLFDNVSEEIKSQKALPSHLFKSLPIVSHNEMMHWITNTLLFALKYVKHESTMYSRLNINRIYSFKLITYIFQHFKPKDHQITYLLEQICLQTKPFQIERVYVSALAALYAETGNSTEIIKKYAQLGSVSYNIKGTNKQVKIKPEDVRTELEDDEDSIKKEVMELCNKYTVQVIFQKGSVMYEYSDKALWNMILYQLEEQGSELIKQKAEELNKEGEQQEP